MAWITINNDECPGCQRKGDEGARVDGKCWRCNLRETMSDVNSLTENAFRSNYGQSKAYAQPIIERMLKRNAADLEALGTADFVCSGCGEPLEPSESGVPCETVERFGMTFDLGYCCQPECTVENPQLRLS
jgi:hypothetical protein